MTDPRDEPLVDAFVERAERELEPITRAEIDRGWQRFRLARSTRERAWVMPDRRRLRAWRWLAGVAAVGAVACFAMLGYQVLAARPLRYTVEGVMAQQGRTIEASPHAGSRLLFSDESHLVLDASTRLTVGGLDPHGAHIDLLDGAVDVFVKPRENGSWVFSAGPFLVRVKGTSFRLAFTPSLGRLDLRMTSGQVELFEPPGKTRAVAAGESVELFATPPSSVGGAAAPKPNAPLPATSTSAPETLPAPARPRTDPPRRKVAVLAAGAAAPARAERTGSSPTESALPWTSWLSQGKFAEVVADADQRGIDQVITRARPGDLAALADAARYIKRYALSRQVLLAMRTRFAATESANDASFFLGRLAEATSGAEAALLWYDLYLRDSPRGLYAKEAMGREMRLRAAGPPERTRGLARQYLERFPQGPEADLARALVRANSE